MFWVILYFVLGYVFVRYVEKDLYDIKKINDWIFFIIFWPAGILNLPAAIETEKQLKKFRERMDKLVK